MTKKTTQKDFIDKATTVHGGLYSYDLVKYTKSSDQILILCIKHNQIFSQIANNHLRGYGCPMCGKIKIGDSLRKDTSKFIAEATKVHEGKYTYHSVTYKNTQTKINVLCNVHGNFSISPSNHLRGRGCPSCYFQSASIRESDTLESFIDKALKKHGLKYDYSKVVYNKSSESVCIVCKSHEDFWQQPSNHLFGSGCPCCSKTGYDPSKAGRLYLLSCGDMLKIGITNLTPKERASKVSKSFGSVFEVRKVWEFSNGQIPQKIETILLRELRSEHQRPTARFEGSSECFLNVDYKKLVSRISDCIAEH
jgi:hypothetical protein